jgi:hypothetical protein
LKDAVDERLFWPTILGESTAIIGVPTRVLFAGMDRETIKKQYYNDHLNLNGAELLTRAITPALLKVYEEIQH